MTAYIGSTNSKAKAVKVVYIGDRTNTGRKVLKVYIGDATGKARLVYEDAGIGNRPLGI